MLFDSVCILICTLHKKLLDGPIRDSGTMTPVGKRGSSLWGTLEDKKPFRRPRSRYEDNIKTGLNRLLCGDWIQVAGRRVHWLHRVNKAPKRRVSYKDGKFVPH